MVAGCLVQMTEMRRVYSNMGWAQQVRKNNTVLPVFTVQEL
jgi:hypothetical protein